MSFHLVPYIFIAFFLVPILPGLKCIKASGFSRTAARKEMATNKGSPDPWVNRNGAFWMYFFWGGKMILGEKFEVAKKNK